MAKKIPYAFGVNGDLTPVPDASTSTELSYQDGWSPDYEKSPEEAGYREIDRGQHNQLWNTVTANIKEWQEQVYPEHQPDTIYPVGMITKYGGVDYLRVKGNTVTPNPSLTSEWVVYSSTQEASPLNNDWNGFLDPEHTVPVQKEDTSTGTRSFASNTEIAPNIYVTTTDSVTFSATGWDWSAPQSIYKLYTFTAEQMALIDEAKVPVYLVDETGKRHFLTSATNGVNVTKLDTTTLKVELTNAIFAELSITKVWEFFVTDGVGYVARLSPGVTIIKLLGSKGFSLGPNGYTVFPNGMIIQYGSCTEGDNNTPIPFPNTFASVVATLDGAQQTTAANTIEIISNSSFKYQAGGLGSDPAKYIAIGD